MRITKDGGRVLIVFETPCIDCGGKPCRGHEQGVLQGFEVKPEPPEAFRRSVKPRCTGQPRLM